MEPVPKTGFNFGSVMGKRLIDYGIMSSSTDSAAEDDTVILTKNNKSELTVNSLEKRRRESTLLPTNEDQVNEENEDRLETQMDTTRLNTEEPLQPARRPRNDYDRSLNSEQSAKLLKKLSNKSGS